MAFNLFYIGVLLYSSVAVACTSLLLLLLPVRVCCTSLSVLLFPYGSGNPAAACASLVLLLLLLLLLLPLLLYRAMVSIINWQP